MLRVEAGSWGKRFIESEDGVLTSARLRGWKNVPTLVIEYPLGLSLRKLTTGTHLVIRLIALISTRKLESALLHLRKTNKALLSWRITSASSVTAQVSTLTYYYLSSLTVTVSPWSRPQTLQLSRLTASSTGTVRTSKR